MFADFHGDLAKGVLIDRYLQKDEDGQLIEGWDEMCRRVADHVAGAEKQEDRSFWSGQFYNLMRAGYFLPNSPTLMNAGLPNGMLSACFVLPIEDSMEGIFETLKHMAIIHKEGGGTGFSFGRLRPRAAKVGVKGTSSGVVSFMSTYNSAGVHIEQGGKRRGANMGILPISHPEIVSFIRCKEVDGQFVNFNISVALTDEFLMKLEKEPAALHVCYHEKTGECYVADDGEWHRDPDRAMTVEQVFNMICEHAWRNGEPGVVFIDEINRKNPAFFVCEIESTNPCGEQPLLPYESCNLGSINLSLYVSEDGIIDYETLMRDVYLAVRFLDNIIDANHYPLKQIEERTKELRPIGLGIMGYADFLLKKKLRYGSPEALAETRAILDMIQDRAMDASIRLGEEKGPYPLWTRSPLSPQARRRNNAILSMAPTGTLSILAACSSGIEPVFRWAIKRKAGDSTYISYHSIAKQWLERGEELPEYFVTAQEVSWLEHVETQAIFQEYTDSAVSKTINMPQMATTEDVKRAILCAWIRGCKGLTVYRDGSRSGQVIQELAEEAGESIAETTESHGSGLPAPYDIGLARGEIAPRPNIVDGKTAKYAIGCGRLYITYNHIGGKPCEIFVQPGESGGCPANSKALGMMISNALRAGIDPDRIIHTLGKVNCPACRGKAGVAVKSCPDAIAKAMVLMKPDNVKWEDVRVTVLDVNEEVIDERIACPKCGHSMDMESGCRTCPECGHSKCS